MTTPTLEEEEVLGRLRGELREWLMKQEERGVPHQLALTALLLFTSSGTQSAGISKERYLEMAGLYYDAYEATAEGSSRWLAEGKKRQS